MAENHRGACFDCFVSFELFTDSLAWNCIVETQEVGGGPESYDKKFVTIATECTGWCEMEQDCYAVSFTRNKEDGYTCAKYRKEDFAFVSEHQSSVFTKVCQPGLSICMLYSSFIQYFRGSIDRM